MKDLSEVLHFAGVGLEPDVMGPQVEGKDKARKGGGEKAGKHARDEEAVESPGVYRSRQPTGGGGACGKGPSLTPSTYLVVAPSWSRCCPSCRRHTCTTASGALHAVGDFDGRKRVKGRRTFIWLASPGLARESSKLSLTCCCGSRNCDIAR